VHERPCVCGCVDVCVGVGVCALVSSTMVSSRLEISLPSFLVVMVDSGVKALTTPITSRVVLGSTCSSWLICWVCACV
jgi:hypothetical protein